MRPRWVVGISSAKYVSTKASSAPRPTPSMTRKAMSVGVSGAKAAPTDSTAYATRLIWNMRRRPKRSANPDNSRAPSSSPANVAPISSDWAVVLDAHPPGSSGTSRLLRATSKKLKKEPSPTTNRTPRCQRPTGSASSRDATTSCRRDASSVWGTARVAPEMSAMRHPVPLFATCSSGRGQRVTGA